MNALVMKCLRSLIEVSRMDRVRNSEVRRRAGIEREFASRADQRVLRWFGMWREKKKNCIQMKEIWFYNAYILIVK